MPFEMCNQWISKVNQEMHWRRLEEEIEILAFEEMAEDEAEIVDFICDAMKKCNITNEQKKADCAFETKKAIVAENCCGWKKKLNFKIMVR